MPSYAKVYITPLTISPAIRLTPLFLIVLAPNPNAGNYIFSMEDLLASDWKKFELPKPAIEKELTIE